MPDKDRKSTRLNSSHVRISYAVFCLTQPPPISTLFPYTTLFRSYSAYCNMLVEAPAICISLLKYHRKVRFYLLCYTGNIFSIALLLLESPRRVHFSYRHF